MPVCVRARACVCVRARPTCLEARRLLRLRRRLLPSDRGAPPDAPASTHRVLTEYYSRVSPTPQRVLTAYSASTTRGLPLREAHQGAYGVLCRGWPPAGELMGYSRVLEGCSRVLRQGVLRVLRVLTGYSGKGHAKPEPMRYSGYSGARTWVLSQCGTQGTRGPALLRRVQVHERAQLEDLRLEPLQSPT